MKIRMEIREDNYHGWVVVERLPNKWYLISSWWIDIIHIEIPRLK